MPVGSHPPSRARTMTERRPGTVFTSGPNIRSMRRSPPQAVGTVAGTQAVQPTNKIRMVRLIKQLPKQKVCIMHQRNMRANGRSSQPCREGCVRNDLLTFP